MLHLVGGQFRTRTLGEMLEVATSCARQAGVTRLCELTHLDRLGIPIFQAVRPNSLSLSTAMGRSSTRRGAIVSALLEALETDAAEKLVGSRAGSLLDYGPAALDIWMRRPRDPLAVSLDASTARSWVDGVDLETGLDQIVPLDLVSQDLTRPAMPDTLMSTVGLASGGTREEALASALTELLEHDIEADWRRAEPSERRECEIDLGSVDHPEVSRAIARVQRAGCDIRLWSLGQGHGIAAILCFIADATAAPVVLPPVAGSGCHPDRAIATLRAIQEAAQARCALISGARDDLSIQTYEKSRTKIVEALLASLCFGPGPLDWTLVPNIVLPSIQQIYDTASRVARARSDLPLIAIDLPSPHPALHIVKIAAPGLCLSERGDKTRRIELPRPCVPKRMASARRIVFAGPSLGKIEVPAGIDLHPPAVAGDLSRLLADPPAAIGLVDGCFETAPSVWHKEILDLMSQGVAVLGAASLGALRAAELHSLGMIGIGAIFTCFKNEVVMRDDAVLVVHAPGELGYMPVSVSLIEAETAILMCCRDRDERRILQRIVRTMSFRERTWPRVLGQYSRHKGLPCSVTQSELQSVPSIKQADVRLLLGALSAARPSSPRERPPMTAYYRRLLSQI